MSNPYSKTEVSKDLDVTSMAGTLCDFIVAHGGSVALGNKPYNFFCHLVWDVWEAGYACGQDTPNEDER